MIDAIILAGGFGTRLARHVPGVPKPLAPIGERPFLDHQIDWLAAQGIGSVVIAAHHMADQIVAYVRARGDAGPGLSVVLEKTPLGTGGAIKNALSALDGTSTVLAINGDTAFDFPLAPMLTRHRASGAEATVAVARVADVARFGTVTMQGERITGFVQASGRAEPGLVNAGAYLLEPGVVLGHPDRAFSMEIDLLPDLARAGRLSGYVLDSTAAFHDIGTPESYDAFVTNSPFAS